MIGADRFSFYNYIEKEKKMEQNQAENAVLFEEVAGYRLEQLAEQLRELEGWPAASVDAATVLYRVCKALRLNRRNIAALLLPAEVDYLQKIGVLDKIEYNALTRWQPAD